MYECYEQIVDWYDAHRSTNLMEQEYLDFVVQAIPSGGSILDVGCGTGKPLALADFFIGKGYRVTGIDGSQKMIRLCRKRFPDQRFIVQDMRSLNLNEQFDAIIAWDSFFHLPPEDQRSMFPIFKAHAKSGSILIFTSGPDEGEVWSDNGGQNLYHASLSPDEYTELLNLHGFKVVRHTIEDPNCGNHTVWVRIYQ
jgi:SAM-dependent methyltransferase